MKIEDYVKKYDPSDQFTVLKNSWQQIDYARGIRPETDITAADIKSVIISGMGGSAISGDLIRNFLRGELKVPMAVNRNYTLPAYAGGDTLVIVSSYSGNTEESLSVLMDALKRGCKIICISTGGEITKVAERNKLPVVKILPGMQPRYALGQSFFSLLKVIEHCGLISDQTDVINSVTELWKKRGEQYSEGENIAIDYARQLTGFIPLIYSAADFTDAAGYRFKCQLNENSKLHAFHNIIPELNHNEIVGWESFRQKDFQVKVVNLLDRDYPEQLKKRFLITSGLISGVVDSDIINLESSQDTFKIRLFDLIYLTDWITYYLAVLRGFDPVEIEYINLLKKQLG